MPYCIPIMIFMVEKYFFIVKELLYTFSIVLFYTYLISSKNTAIYITYKL